MGARPLDIDLPQFIRIYCIVVWRVSLCRNGFAAGALHLTIVFRFMTQWRCARREYCFRRLWIMRLRLRWRCRAQTQRYTVARSEWETNKNEKKLIEILVAYVPRRKSRQIVSHTEHNRVNNENFSPKLKSRIGVDADKLFWGCTTTNRLSMTMQSWERYAVRGIRKQKIEKNLKCANCGHAITTETSIEQRTDPQPNTKLVVKDK